MAQFDFESGVSGAAAGSSFGPVGAAAGFVLGGFLGGKKKGKTDALIREIIRLSKPEELLRLTTVFRQNFRELIASGLGPSFQQGIQANITKAGLKDTGIGLSLKNAALAIPDIKALELAINQARESQRLEIGALQGTLPTSERRENIFGDISAGQLADLGAFFKGLGGGGATSSFPAGTTTEIPRTFTGPGAEIIDPFASQAIFPTEDEDPLRIFRGVG